jgi:chromosome segregation ATPase
MKFTILLALAALIISGTAAYFSIVGLAAIFAAAFIPTVIMGSAVEIGKLITVAWLHFDWYNIGKRLKYSLCFPVFAVMLITSVGVFGFLSRAHVAQTAAAEESVAQVERIEKEVARLESVIDRAEIKVSDLESGTFKVDNATQAQIDKEQARIDSAYERVQPAIDEQNAIIAGQTKLFEDQIAAIDDELALLKRYIEEGEIKKAQQLINEPSPGGWGPKTTETARKWRLERNSKKDELLKKIEEATQNNQTIVAARKEIQRLRGKAEQQIADSNALINRLRDKIANSQKADNTDELLDQQYARINKANVDIETLTDEKYTLEAEYRQLEAEVGPIKYIAEFVYREEADSDLLEEAVKWLIILLLLCLDPFAILLVMAATDRYKLTLKEREENIEPIDTEELEAALEKSKEEYEGLMKVIVIRNKEMNELREETQEIINEANEKISENEELQEYKDLYPSLQTAYEQLATKLKETEDIRDQLTTELSETEEMVKGMANHEMDMANEIMELDNARKALQGQLDNTALSLSSEDAETIAELIEQRNTLQAELEAEKKSRLENLPINIQELKDTEVTLREKVQVLEDRISSMIKLSDFDLASAQAFVEINNENKALREHLASVTSQYNKLKESIETGK